MTNSQAIEILNDFFENGTGYLNDKLVWAIAKAGDALQREMSELKERIKMKKSVKILAIIMTLILVLTALTGCGTKNTTDNKKEEKELSRGQINERNRIIHTYTILQEKM